MKLNKKIKAFTLVELIVVVTILSILSTIGFVSYSGYLAGVRDTNRVSQLKAIGDALHLYTTKSSLPRPDSKVDVMSGSTLIAYQGDIGKDVIETISYTSEGKDPKDDTYFSYYLTKNRKYFQLMAFLEEDPELAYKPHTNPLLLGEEVAQALDYENRHPHVEGSKLGILTTDTNKPIQKTMSGSIDITDTSKTSNLISYLKTNETFTGTTNIAKLGDIAKKHGYGYSASGNTLTYVDYSKEGSTGDEKSCKEILDNGKSNRDGVYTINPSGISFQVYCDMTTDGGGWTLIGRGREAWSWNNGGKNTTQVTSNLGTVQAFIPAYYSSSLIDDIMGKNVKDLTDGVRLKRATNTTGSSYQEVRWKFSTQTGWSWLFDNTLGLTNTIINGVDKGSGDTRDDYNGGSNDSTRIFTWGRSSHAYKRGFSYGSSVNAGTNSSTNFLWENISENHSIPYTEVYIRE